MKKLEFNWKCTKCGKEETRITAAMDPGIVIDCSLFWCPHCEAKQVISYQFTSDGIHILGQAELPEKQQGPYFRRNYKKPRKQPGEK
jgi:hypothetical protein